MYVLDLEGVISNVHRVNPGVLEHFAADVNEEVLPPLDDATRNSCFEEVGVGDGIIIHLGETGRRAESGKRHLLRESRCWFG